MSYTTAIQLRAYAGRKFSKTSHIKLYSHVCLAGGYNRVVLKVNKDVTSIMSSLMIVASISLIVPSTLYATFSKSSEPEEHILTLSYVTSTILLIFYLVYFYFQLKSHKHLFEAEEEEGHELGP